jgi:hypothetical protein
MPNRGTQIFIQTPEEFAERILHPAEVIGEVEGGFGVKLQDALTLEVGNDVNLYYEVERQFMQQPARCIPLAPGASPAASGARAEAEPEAEAEGEPDPVRVTALETTGSLISAECREVYRVSTITANLTAALANEETCPLTDISSTGFSVIASAAHEIGAVLPATLRFEDKQFTGQARIQSIKQLIVGRTRYGLRNLDEKRARRDLAKGQQQIAAAVQRMQLRRKAANGV